MPVGYPQQVRWMHGDEARPAVEFCATAKAADGKRFACERQNRCRAQCHHDFRVDELQLLIEPPPVVLHFTCCRPLMDSPLSALLELEVLDGIGDIDALAIKAGFCHCAIKKLTGRAYERPAVQIFLVAGLFANKGDRSADRPFPQHCARPAFHQRLRCRDESIERLKKFLSSAPTRPSAPRA